MPGAESGGVLAMWFSYDYADVHFVSIDTSTDFPDAPEGETGDSHMPWFPSGHFAADGAYMAWLAADLAAARARGARWIIAGGHRPTEDLHDPAPLLALFKENGVDAYFAGHGHSCVSPARFQRLPGRSPAILRAHPQLSRPTRQILPL